MGNDETIIGREFDVLWLVITNPSDDLHLFHMLGGMVRVDHFILNRHVIATEEFDDISPRVGELSDIVDNTFDGDLVAFQSLQRTDGRLGGRTCIVSNGLVHSAVA